MRMHEQKASKAARFVARIGIWNLVWMGLFGVLLLVAALIWLLPYNSLPTATWRNSNSTLPWEQDGLRVEKLCGHWESAAGNERMMLRVACYPAAELELGEAEGSGMLYLFFTDDKGHQAGDTITVWYDKGQFRPRKEVNIEAAGNRLRVFVEAGFEKMNDYELHLHDESRPLWRVWVHHRPEGTAEMKLLGYETIPATLLK